MYLWAAIDTSDKYERLCAVADTAQELAEKLNIKCSTIYANRAKVKKGHYEWIQRVFGWKVFHKICWLYCKLKGTGYQTFIVGEVCK